MAQRGFGVQDAGARCHPGAGRAGRADCWAILTATAATAAACKALTPQSFDRSREVGRVGDAAQDMTCIATRAETAWKSGDRQAQQGRGACPSSGGILGTNLIPFEA